METQDNVQVESEQERKRRLAQERQVRYHARHPEKRKEFQQNWLNNPENQERKRLTNRKSAHKRYHERGEEIKSKRRDYQNEVNAIKVSKNKNYWKQYYLDHYWEEVCYKAKTRSNKAGWESDLTPEFLESIATKRCPIYDVVLEYAGGLNNPKAASLDRKNNNEHYTKDNVWFISNRANKLKRDATTQELKILVQKLEEHGIT